MTAKTSAERTAKTSAERTAKTSAERTAKHRAGLAEKRFELSPPPHPDDRPAIKAFAAKLAAKRAKLATRRRAQI